ncbi:MAG TPA: hypothetical protein PLG95_08080, partial [Methanoculleus sp.]|nr:hypothetical protein [Methanoculleus sp.]
TATYTPGTSTDLALAVTKGDTPGSGSSGSTPSGSSGSGSPSGSSFTPPAAPATEYTGSGTLDTDARGAVQHAVVIAAAGGDARLTIAEGVLAQDRFGRPLDTVSVETAPPGDATRAVRCGPDGATFDPAIEVSFVLTPEEWEQAGQFVVRWYNSTAGAWEPLATTTHASTHTVTATISHFTLVAVFAVPADIPEATVTATPAGSETPTSTPAAQWLPGLQSWRSGSPRLQPRQPPCSRPVNLSRGSPGSRPWPGRPSSSGSGVDRLPGGGENPSHPGRGGVPWRCGRARRRW